MERTVYRMELRKKRVREIEKNKRRLAVFILLTIFLVVGIYTSFNAKAQNNTRNARHKDSVSIEMTRTTELRYMSHQVVKGSTLWDISTDISIELDLSILETIDLIKGINNLNTDMLYEGQSIIVPYLKVIDFYV